MTDMSKDFDTVQQSSFQETPPARASGSDSSVHFGVLQQPEGECSMEWREIIIFLHWKWSKAGRNIVSNSILRLH